MKSVNLTFRKSKLRNQRATIDRRGIDRGKKKRENGGQGETIDDPCRLISFTVLGSPRGYRSLNIGRIDGLAAV